MKGLQAYSPSFAFFIWLFLSHGIIITSRDYASIKLDLNMCYIDHHLLSLKDVLIS